jgi:hypothetical protein
VPQRLPTAGRPDEMSHWQKRGRKYTSPPKITAVLKFEEAFESWWKEIRERAEQSKDGGVLRYSGANGIILILLLLCWWGQAVADEAGAKTRRWSAWNKHVVEVLQEFNKITTSGRKRLLAVDDDASPSLKRCVECTYWRSVFFTEFSFVFRAR